MITLPLRMLAAVAPAMGNKDVRYYVNGVHIERVQGGVIAVATNGSALIAARETLPNGVDSDRAALVARGQSDYRLKPAPPAKLYVDLDGEGRPAHTYASPMVPMPGTTRVTYVLESPDADD